MNNWGERGVEETNSIATSEFKGSDKHKLS